jgi:competence protein ComEC
MLLAFIGFILGTAVQLQQEELFSYWLYVPVALLAGVFVARQAIKNIASQKTARRWLVLVACASLGFALTGARALHYQAQLLAPALEGQDIDVVGLVSAMPQFGLEGTRFKLMVEGASQAGRTVELPRQLQLGWYRAPERNAAAQDDPLSLNRAPPALRAGERWRMTVRLKAPHGNMNPHGFDYELWLWEQGLGATGYVRATPGNAAPRRLAGTWHYPIEQLRQAMRERIYARVADARLAGVVAALAVGDQAAIERADWDVFRATGVAHLMSISGLHITMFAWAAVALIGALWRRSALWGGRLCLRVPAPTAARLGGFALALAYALFSGFAVPAQRTVWMLLAVTALRLAGLRWHWNRVWALACVVVAAVDPWALLSAGFWLSFVAVGVLFASDRGADHVATNNIADHAESTPARGQFISMLGQSLGRMLREQSVVTLALAPLSLVLFGQLSLVAWAANLLAIPWVTLVVTPLALGGAVFAPLWSLAASALGWMVQGLQVLAAWPWATYSAAAPPALIAALAILGGVLLVLRLPWAVRAGAAALWLPLLLWQPPRPAAGQFELLAVDVGQGNAVLVRTAEHSLLYDAGPRFSPESDAGHRTLVPLLRALGEKLDTLVLSHRDSDHTGGAAAVLQTQPQAVLLSSIEAAHALQSLRPAQRCMAGQHWEWDGVRFEVLHPQAADFEVQSKPNTMSCVLRVSTAAQTALLAGDIEAAQEARLASAGALNADVLLVPHHGSKTSSSPAFVQAVQPRFALVQNGYRNRFSHPVPAVVERWQAAGARVIDSPRCGAAAWSSAQPGAIACERDAARRYWHHPMH